MKIKVEIECETREELLAFMADQSKMGLVMNVPERPAPKVVEAKLTTTPTGNFAEIVLKGCGYQQRTGISKATAVQRLVKAVNCTPEWAAMLLKKYRAKKVLSMKGGKVFKFGENVSKGLLASKAKKAEPKVEVVGAV